MSDLKDVIWRIREKFPVDHAELLDLADRIEALEAEVERLRDDSWFDQFEEQEQLRDNAEQRLSVVEAENERLREALEQFLALIKHQYSGSREAMNALQEADNFASATLAKLQEPSHEA